MMTGLAPIVGLSRVDTVEVRVNRAA